MYPWQTHTLPREWIECYHNSRKPYPSHVESYWRWKEYLPDNQRMKYRKGDIVKFGCGFSKILPGGWVNWFILKKDEKKFWPRDGITPVYAMNQYGVIAGRYRIVKQKWRMFYDYGTVVMMLTGPKAGKMRHYWMTKPYIRKITFPQNLTYKYLKRDIPPEILEIFGAEYADTNSDRNLLLSRLNHVLNVKGV